MPSEKVVCHTPTPGKKPTRIDKWKYDLVRGAILKSVPDKGEGVLFKDLPGQVKQAISAQDLKRLGSVSWYTTVVKLELEVVGEIKRVAGASPQRLLRC